MGTPEKQPGSRKNMTNKPEEQYRLAFAISLGGMLELYDFMVYAMMASYIAENFFPSSDPMTSLLGTFATFAVGYLSRPLGGFFFGHLGDRYGRKNTFTLTIFIMALTTLLIGCLPTYASIGVMAPVLLVLLRLFQGFSLGGELPGAMTYMGETTPGRSGLVIGILFSALMMGLSLATFVHGMMTLFFDVGDMNQWGWRVPFWFGGALGGLSYYIRSRFHESGLFLTLDLARQRASVPVVQLFKEHRIGVLCGLAIIAVCGSVVTILGVYMPSYLTTLHGYDRADVAWQASLAYMMSAPLCLLTGMLNDRKPHKVLLAISVVIVCCMAFPFYHYIGTADADLSKIMLVAAIVSSFVSGGLPPMLVSLFPTEVRYTGVAATYNIGTTIFGGLAPFSTTLLTKYLGITNGPATYIVIVSILAVTVILLPWPNHPLHQVQSPSTR